MTNIWFLKQVSKNNHWQQGPMRKFKDTYSAPDYPWANGLVVASMCAHWERQIFKLVKMTQWSRHPA